MCLSNLHTVYENTLTSSISVLFSSKYNSGNTRNYIEKHNTDKTLCTTSSSSCLRSMSTASIRCSSAFLFCTRPSTRASSLSCFSQRASWVESSSSTLFPEEHADSVPSPELKCKHLRQVSGKYKKNTETIFYRSYVNRQHLRLWSLASLCLNYSYSQTK